MCLVWISEQAGNLNIIQVNFLSSGRAMAQAFSRLTLTAEAWFRSQVSRCEIYGGQSGTGTVLRLSSVGIIVHVLHIIFIYVLFLTRRTKGRARKLSTKRCSVRNRRALNRKVFWQRIRRKRSDVWPDFFGSCGVTFGLRVSGFITQAWPTAAEVSEVLVFPQICPSLSDVMR